MMPYWNGSARMGDSATEPNAHWVTARNRTGRLPVVREVAQLFWELLVEQC